MALGEGVAVLAPDYTSLVACLRYCLGRISAPVFQLSWDDVFGLDMSVHSSFWFLQLPSGLCILCVIVLVLNCVIV